MPPIIASSSYAVLESEQAWQEACINSLHWEEDRKSGFRKGKKWPRKTLLGLDPRQRQSLACTFLGELKGSRWLARHISAAGQCERVRAGPREDEPSR
jgi:hypothetical protein